MTQVGRRWTVFLSILSLTALSIPYRAFGEERAEKAAKKQRAPASAQAAYSRPELKNPVAQPGWYTDPSALAPPARGAKKILPVKAPEAPTPSSETASETFSRRLWLLKN